MPGQKKQKKPTRTTVKQSTDMTGKRTRLSPEVRRTQILDAAAQLIVQQGYLPLPMEGLARVAGTSKALIYTYFATQYDIFNSLLRRELAGLTIAGLDTAASVTDFDQAVLLCSMLYFEHVAQTGPLLYILITDRYMAGHFDPDIRQAGEIMLSKLTNAARGALTFSKKEIQAAIEMIAVIPQNAGGLVFFTELEPAVARQICHTLVLSSLATLRTIKDGPV